MQDSRAGQPSASDMGQHLPPAVAEAREQVRVSSPPPGPSRLTALLPVRRLPIHLHLAALALLFVLLAGVTTLYVRVQARSDAVAQAERDAAFASEAAAKDLATTLAATRATVNRTAASPGIARIFDDATGCSLSAAEPSVLSIVASDGTVLCSSRTSSVGSSVGKAEWLPQARSAPSLLAPVADPLSGDQVLIVSAPIGSLGFMAAIAPLPPVGESLAARYGGARRLEILITTSDGKLLSRSVNGQLGPGATLQGTPFWQASNPNERPDVDGVDRLYAQSSIAGTDWLVFAGASRDDTLADANRLFERGLLIVLVGLLALLGATLFLWVRIARPIQRLGLAVQTAAASGGVAPPVAVAGPAEVAALAENVNRLSSAVQRELEERTRAEHALREANEDLETRVRERTVELGERATALEAANRELESFSYSVSHDLRAPLRGIDGFSQALIEDYGGTLGDEGLDMLQRVRASASRMGHLIDDLLDLSRVTLIELSPETVDISELAASICDDLRQSDPHRQITVSIAPGLQAAGDRRLIRIALVNLLGNAWKFTGQTPAPRIEVGQEDVGGAPAFRVRDNGAGFEMEYAGKLFGAFQRMHGASEFPGTGVGLATVQRVVRRHGGRVWAEAAPGEGATFYFTLSPPIPPAAD